MNINFYVRSCGHVCVHDKVKLTNKTFSTDIYNMEQDVCLACVTPSNNGNSIHLNYCKPCQIRCGRE